MGSVILVYVVVVAVIVIPITFLIWTKSLSQGMVICLIMLMTPVAIWYIEVMSDAWKKAHLRPAVIEAPVTQPAEPEVKIERRRVIKT